jgi:hypothetical protein
MRSNCIDRAGQMLITCIWLEKRLIDLIILKDRPILIKKVNRSSSKIQLPTTFCKERAKLWKEDFSIIKKIFIEKFNPSRLWLENLNGIYDRRNMISHSYISLHRDYLLYRPSGRKSKIYRLIKEHEMKEIINPAKPTIFAMHLSDDKKFNQAIKVLEEFDQVYLKSIAENMGLNYEKIR